MDNFWTKSQPGPCIDGAWHQHRCPECETIISGTGETLCYVCANPPIEKEEEEENG